jgi:hypothetical protein
VRRGVDFGLEGMGRELLEHTRESGAMFRGAVGDEG